MKALAMAALALVAVGCGGNVTLSTRVGAKATAGAPLLVGGDVDLGRVRIVIRQIELKQGDSTANDVEFEAGPVLLDLSGDALAGGVTQQFAVDAPARTYDRLEFEVHPVDSSRPTDSALAEMFDRGASVILDGTYGGNAFSYSSSLTAEQRIFGAFDVTGSGDNVTLNLDPSGWFLDSSGAPLDPTVEANHGLIEENLKLSIDAFDDDDHDGGDDATEGTL